MKYIIKKLKFVWYADIKDGEWYKYGKHIYQKGVTDINCVRLGKEYVKVEVLN